MYQLSELDQNLKIDKYNENYNSDCNNKNLVEEENNIIHTPNKNSYKSKDLLSQKCNSTNQNVLIILPKKESSVEVVYHQRKMNLIYYILYNITVIY